MERHDPEELIETVEGERAAIREQYLPAAEWFLENPGLARRGAVVDELADHLDVDLATANLVVGHLVSDEADPVQQIVRPAGGKYVGVISHAEHDWLYAYDRYDDVEGRQRRAVCAHCVQSKRSAADVAHFTRPPGEYDLDRARTALALHYQVDHEGRPLTEVLAADLGVDPAAFAERHGLVGPGALSLRDVTRRLDADPALSDGTSEAADRLSVPDVEVEPGASLVSGTKISAEVAWHAGNDGPGSGLDADTLDGKQLSEITATTTTTITSRTNTAFGSFKRFSFPSPPTTATSVKLKAYQAGTSPSFISWDVTSIGNYNSRTATITTTVTTGMSIYHTWGGYPTSTTVGGTGYFYY